MRSNLVFIKYLSNASYNFCSIWVTSGDKILTKYDLTLHVYDAYLFISIVRYWMEVEYSSTSTESSLYLGEFASGYFNLRCIE